MLAKMKSILCVHLSLHDAETVQRLHLGDQTCIWGWVLMQLVVLELSSKTQISCSLPQVRFCFLIFHLIERGMVEREIPACPNAVLAVNSLGIGLAVGVMVLCLTLGSVVTNLYWVSSLRPELNFLSFPKSDCLSPYWATWSWKSGVGKEESPITCSFLPTYFLPPLPPYLPLLQAYTMVTQLTFLVLVKVIWYLYGEIISGYAYSVTIFSATYRHFEC